MTAPDPQAPASEQALMLFKEHVDEARSLLRLTPNAKRFVTWEGKQVPLSDAIAAAGVHAAIANACARAAAVMREMELGS